MTAVYIDPLVGAALVHLGLPILPGLPCPTCRATGWRCRNSNVLYTVELIHENGVGHGSIEVEAPGPVEAQELAQRQLNYREQYEWIVGNAQIQN